MILEITRNSQRFQFSDCKGLRGRNGKIKTMQAEAIFMHKAVDSISPCKVYGAKWKFLYGLK